MSEISKISANINGIQYNAITPKFILNKELFPGLAGNIQYKTKEHIAPGINVVDIDWNGVLVDDVEISHTSELLTLMANMYLTLKDEEIEDASLLWEDVVIIEPTYTLYYEDSNDNKLENFTPLNITCINKDLLAPYTADHIGVYNENEKLYSLPLKSKYIKLNRPFGLRLYRLGVISDVHHNDTCLANEGGTHNESDSGNGYNEYEDLDHVLDYYKNNTSIEFICCAGDISTDNIDHVKAFKNHVDLHNRVYPNIPLKVYTCKGNHDNAASYQNNNRWLEYTIPTNSKYEIHYFESGDRTSFYFIKDDDVFIFFNLDYGNGGQLGGPLTFKDSLTDSTFDENVNYDSRKFIKKVRDNSYRFYHPATIRELQSLLDRYRNNRVFIFTHQPFANKAGNVGYSYTSDISGRGPTKVLSGLQFALLNEMNNYYTNAIWFSGHSHYQLKWQKVSTRANICNWDVLEDDYDYTDYNNYARNKYNNYLEDYKPLYKKSGYCVHIPSSSRPLRPESEFPSLNYYSLIADPGAEGYVMDVYINGINLRGVQFADENSKTKVQINGEKRPIVLDDCVINESKSGHNNEQRVSTTEDGYLLLTFTYESQQVLFTNYVGNYVDIEEIYILDKNENDITSDYINKDDPKIGLYIPGNKYSLSSSMTQTQTTTIGETSITGLQFNISSRINLTSDKYPIYVKLKAYTADAAYTINYEDYYVSDADYWVPVPRYPSTNIESKDYLYFEDKVASFSCNHD